MSGLIKIFIEFKQWPAVIFVMFGLFFGTAAIILTPPLQGPDESAHIYRIWQLSEGGLIPKTQQGETGGFLPCRLAALGGENMNCGDCPDKSFFSNPEICKNQKIFADFPTSAVYLPFMYLPQIAMASVMHFFPISALSLLYLLRFAGLIGYLSLATAAIVIVPFRRWTLFMVGLLPMVIWISSMVSGDPMTLGYTILMIALWLRATSVPPGTLRGGYVITLGITAALLILAKPGYFLFPLLLLSIPSIVWVSSRHARFVLWSCISVAFIVQGAWSFSSVGKFAQYTANSRSFDNVAQHVDAVEQIAGLARQPLSLLHIWGNDLRVNGYHYFAGMVGVFGWYTLWFPDPVVALAWVGLFVITISEPAKFVWRRWLLVLIISGCSFLYISLVLYITWTYVGSDIIYGIQGRYLLPLIIAPLLLLPSIARDKKNYWRRFVAAIVVFISLFLLSCMMFVLWQRYYQ